MPGVFHLPTDRRSFLRVALTGAAAVVAGCQSARTRGTGAAASAEFRAALLSDTHIPGDRVNGHRGFNPWEHLKRAAADVAASSPEAAFLSGDAARLIGTEADYVELKSLLEPIAFQAPVYIGLGNHDDRANFRKVFGPAGPMASKAGDRHVLVVEHPVSRFVVLDSLLQPNLTPGLLGKAQREWLDQYLTDHRDRPVVLFVHHTLEDRDGDLLDSDRFLGVLRRHRHVKAVFYGHSHVWECRERDGLQLINLPAMGYNFNDQQPVGWVQARFHRRGVDLTLRAFAGNVSLDGQTVALQWS